MDDKLQYRIKNVYGTERKYPVNETAQVFAQLEKSKTLSDTAIRAAQVLGFKVEQVI